MVPIAKTLLGSIIPQRSMTTSHVDALVNKVFTFDKVIHRDDRNLEVDLTEEKTDEEINRLAVRLKNESGRFFTLSLRQFVSLPIASADNLGDDKIAEELEKSESEEVKPLYARYLVEEEGQEADAEASDNTVLPEKIKIVYAVERKNEAGDVIYPARFYKKFRERSKDDERAHKINNPNVPFTEDAIYQDFTFINSLPGTELAVQPASIEAQKTLVAVEVQ